MTGDAIGGEWWRGTVIYQIYPRSFQDSNGDGIGDLDGVTARLDYLAETLGVDAIWLSPFYPSPMADFGYDVADYCNVDPMFGDLDAFDRMLEASHLRGLKVIVDFVPNHSSNQHDWFIESSRSIDSPKRDWYVWADGRGDEPPNNWQSVFGGPAWTLDESTNQWYLHSFLAEQPDLNWRNPETRAAMLDALRFWMDRGVDGFRVDVAHFLLKDPELRDNPVRSDRETRFKSMGAYDGYHHIHDRGHPDIHGLFRDMRLIIDEYPDRFSVGEIHLWDPAEWAAYYGDGDEFHMPFNFVYLYAEWTPARFRELVDSIDGVVPDGQWPNHVFGNHDEPRLSTRRGPQRERAAAVLLLAMRGTPTLYYGDELGMRQSEIPENQQQDPWGRRVPGLGRDGCRTPMQWDSSAYAGFSDSKPWLPVHKDFVERNVVAQLGDRKSLLNLYRKLLEVRRATPSLQTGSMVWRDDSPEGVLAFERSSASETTFVAVNFTDEALEVPCGAGSILVSTSRAGEGQSTTGRISLEPNGAVLVHLAQADA